MRDVYTISIPVPRGPIAHPSWCEWEHSAGFDHIRNHVGTFDVDGGSVGLLIIQEGNPRFPAPPHVRIGFHERDSENSGRHSLTDLAPATAAAMARMLLAIYGEHPFARALLDLAELAE